MTSEETDNVRRKGSVLTTVLRPRGPLDFDHTLARYRIWGEDAANRYVDGTFWRVKSFGARHVLYSVGTRGSVERPHLVITLHGPARSSGALGAIKGEVRNLLNLEADLAGFYRWAEHDPLLAHLGRRFYGMRPPLAADLFEMLVSSITAQQVNLGFAFTTRSRLIRRYGQPMKHGGQVYYAFPRPVALARARASDLRRMQFSARKAEYIIGLARLVESGALDVDELSRLDNGGVIERITEVRGLGRWTAEWFLARGLGRGDVCPAGDLGVRKAFGAFYFKGRQVSEEGIRRLAGRWGDYQNLAVHYLLAGLREAEAITAELGGPGKVSA